MRYRRSLFVAVALGFGSLALGFGLLALPLLSIAQTEDSEEIEQQAAVAAKVPLVIPSAESKRTNPVRATQSSLESGSRLYASQCAMCHGARGDGRGDLAVSIRMKMPDFRGGDNRKTRTDGDVFYILSRGHGSMPAHERLADEFRWNIVNHVRSLSK